MRWNGGRIKGSKDRYERILKPDHPKASKGYVYEHTLIAEAAMGKYLPDKAQIHHINGIKNDNRNENLVVCQNKEYHSLLHKRAKAIKACGHKDWEMCWLCKKWDDPANMVTWNDRRCVYRRYQHRKCYSKYEKESRAQRAAKKFNPTP